MGATVDGAASFGDLLRGHRLAVDLTQETLAERAGISAQAVGALERGDRRFPHRHTVDRLADALGLSADARRRLARAGSRRDGPRRNSAAPRQLPPDVAHFTGRAEHVDTLAGVLGRSAVAAVVGMAGVGKTSLAVHIGHRLADRFPDGQLYLDLHGAREPLPVTHALGMLLRALGVAPDAVPTDVAEATAVLRSRLAHRRVLLVLDDAASGTQVAPLLPGTGATVITSRQELSGLPQAHHLRLDVLDEPDAVALLAAAAGPARTTAEPDAAAAIVRRCGRLPLAIELVGARLAARPDWPLSHLAERMSAENRRLDELRHDDTVTGTVTETSAESGVRASFAMSVDHLDKVAATAFELLGLVDGHHITVPVAARLLDVDEPTGERVLEQLANRHLLRAMSPGRYRMHDLLHEYARERAGRTVDRTAALGRVLDLLVGVVWSGHTLAAPRTVRGDWAGSPAGSATGSTTFASSADAFAWLDEHRGLLRLAAEPGMPPETATRLGIGTFTYFLGRGHSPDWVELAEATLAAAQSTNDWLATAIARMDLGIATADLAPESDAVRTLLQEAIAEFRALDHAHGLAMCLMNTAEILEAAGDITAAVAHNEEALAISAAAGDFPGGEAVVCANLGGLHLGAGDRATALTYFERGLALSEEIGYAIGVVQVLHRIGEIHHADGDSTAAERVLERCVALCREHGYPVTEAAARTTLGFILRDQSDMDGARAHWRAAVAGYEKYGKLTEAAELRNLV